MKFALLVVAALLSLSHSAQAYGVREPMVPAARSASANVASQARVLVDIAKVSNTTSYSLIESMRNLTGFSSEETRRSYLELLLSESKLSIDPRYMGMLADSLLENNSRDAQSVISDFKAKSIGWE